VGHNAAGVTGVPVSPTASITVARRQSVGGDSPLTPEIGNTDHDRDQVLVAHGIARYHLN
jgi:hypothetical protein